MENGDRALLARVAAEAVRDGAAVLTLDLVASVVTSLGFLVGRILPHSDLGVDLYWTAVDLRLDAARHRRAFERRRMMLEGEDE